MKTGEAEIDISCIFKSFTVFYELLLEVATENCPLSPWCRSGRMRRSLGMRIFVKSYLNVIHYYFTVTLTLAQVPFWAYAYT